MCLGEKFQFSPLLVNISKTIRDRAILSEFLTRRVIQKCPMERGKIATVFSPPLVVILDFSRK